jgi:hypothetical protein
MLGFNWISALSIPLRLCTSVDCKIFSCKQTAAQHPDAERLVPSQVGRSSANGGGRGSQERFVLETAFRRCRRMRSTVRGSVMKETIFNTFVGFKVAWKDASENRQQEVKCRTAHSGGERIHVDRTPCGHPHHRDSGGPAASGDQRREGESLHRFLSEQCETASTGLDALCHPRTTIGCRPTPWITMRAILRAAHPDVGWSETRGKTLPPTLNAACCFPTHVLLVSIAVRRASQSRWAVAADGFEACTR